MKTSERKELVSRMVAMAKTERKAAQGSLFTYEERMGVAEGFMRAARMVKGYATQARWAQPRRKAA